MCLFFLHSSFFFLFFFNDPAPTEIYTLSLHDALPICCLAGRASSTPASRRREATRRGSRSRRSVWAASGTSITHRSEEHTSELQSRVDLVCRLLLEKKKKIKNTV